MSAWVIFRRARTILFAYLALVGLAWTTLFAIFLFREFSHFSRDQKIVVIGLLAVYLFTAILLYLMIVVQFVFWWDVARVFALLSLHTGGSMLFMHLSPKFPCRGFGTVSMCRKYVHTILIGCWVFTGTVLCFTIALVIMGFIPRPVESLQGGEEDGFPLSPSSFGTGESVDEEGVEGHTSFYSIDSRTGLVTFQDQGALLDAALYPDSDSKPISGTRQETITEGPPHLLEKIQNSPILSLTHDNDGTTSSGNTPRGRASVVSGTQRVKLYQSDPFCDPTSPPVSINSQASMIRTDVGEGTLRNPPTLVTTQRDRATENTPTLYSVHHHSLPTWFGNNSKPERTSPDHWQTETPSAHSFDSFAAGVHSKWVGPTSRAVPPPALTPGVARSHTTFGDPVGPTYDISRVRKMSAPTETMRHSRVRQPTDLHAKEGLERGSDGQVWDQTQWQRLVLSAAGKS